MPIFSSTSKHSPEIFSQKDHFLIILFKRTSTSCKNSTLRDSMTTCLIRAPFSEEIPRKPTFQYAWLPSEGSRCLLQGTFLHFHTKYSLTTSMNRRTKVSCPIEEKMIRAISAFLASWRHSKHQRQCWLGPLRWAKQWRCITGCTKRKISME